MSFKLDFKQRRIQLIFVSLGLLFFYWLTKGETFDPETDFTNEEVNSILSGVDQASDIEREVILNQRLHSPYLNKDLESDNWDIFGDALVKNTEYIRLTSETKDQQGLISNKNSFNSDGFEIEFSFNIHGTAKANQLKGDGFAMFLTSDRQTTIGPVFGSLDFFDGLGIVFDTYRNDKKGPIFPYIMAMNSKHAKYDKEHDGKANELAGCSVKQLYNPQQGFSKVRLIHTTEDGYLSLDYNVNGNWQNCFSIKDVFIPKERYLSFSAATGELVENVDLFDLDIFELKQFNKVITSWRDFTEHIDEEEEDEQEKKTPFKKRSRKQRSRLRAKLRNRKLRNQAFKLKKREGNESVSFFRTLWNILKTFIILLAFLIVFYVGFTVYRVKKKAWKSQRKTTGLLD